MANADGRALSKVAREILHGISIAGKGEPTSPVILNAALRKLGGAERFGEICAEEMQKARGNDLTPEEKLNRKPSPHFTFKWAEMLTRLSLKNDERESLEVTNLTDEELVGSLRGLAMDLVKTSEDFRRLIVVEAITQQPDLVHAAMNAAGMEYLEPQKDGEISN